ncbi:uncharacterized protein [Temnothorax longispinosus]|uniref:uncharacterized protein n=1 Tax=Temnothorax longispinosus TaxID=300112 RepID=UPI003A9903CD
MPSCCISHGKTSSQKGFSLYSLPADPSRRAVWRANIEKYDLNNSSKNVFIGEIHFSDDMWEKPRSDGKRNVKQNAVPTRFNNILTCDVRTLGHVPNISIDVSFKHITFNNIDVNVLYNIAGYTVNSRARGKSARCATCLTSADSTKYNRTMILYANVVPLKCFRNTTLFFVTADVFKYFRDMEVRIQHDLSHLNNVKCTLRSFFREKMKNISCTSLNNCHDVSFKIKKRFRASRIKISCMKGRVTKKIYSSKTRARHTILAIKKANKLVYGDLTLPAQLTENEGYHSECYKRFTALSRKYKPTPIDDSPPSTNSETQPPNQLKADLDSQSFDAEQIRTLVNSLHLSLVPYAPTHHTRASSTRLDLCIIDDTEKLISYGQHDDQTSAPAGTMALK